MREVHVGKNVGLTMTNLYIVQDYMQKTKQNFSKTLNIIIQQWDEITIELAKYKQREQEEKEQQRKETINTVLKEGRNEVKN